MWTGLGTPVGASVDRSTTAVYGTDILDAFVDGSPGRRSAANYLDGAPDLAMVKPIQNCSGRKCQVVARQRGSIKPAARP